MAGPLLTEAGINFVFANKALGEKPITLTLDDVPFPQALTKLLQTMEFGKELSYRFLNGICVIERAGWKPEYFQQTLSLQLTQTDISASLRAICRSCNQSYTLPSTFAGRVSSQGNDIPFKECLSNVLRQLGKSTQSVLTYTDHDGIISFLEVLGIENPNDWRGGDRMDPTLSPKEIRDSIASVIRESPDCLTAYQILGQLSRYVRDQLLSKQETLSYSKQQVHTAAASVNQIALQLCQSGVCEQTTIATQKLWVEIGKDLYQPENATVAGFRIRRNEEKGLLPR